MRYRNITGHFTYPDILRWLFLIILFSAGIGKISFRGLGIPFEFGRKIENMILFIFVLWLPTLKFYPQLRPKLTHLDTFIFLFSLFQIITTFYYHTGYRYLTKLLCGILAYYIITSLYTTAFWRKRIIITLILANLWTFSGGIYCFLKGIYFSCDKRILTLYKHPNITAFVTNFILLFSIAIFPHLRRRLERLLIFLAIPVTSICLILTLSRTGWIAFILSFFLLLSILRNKKLSISFLFIFTISILISGFLFTSIKTRLSSILHPLQEVSIKNRLIYWNTAVTMARQHPLVGIGLGQKQFMENYPSYMSEPTGEHPIHAHNTYLHILATSGIGGGISFLLLLLFSYITVFRNLRLSSSCLLYGIYTGTLASLTGFCIAFITEVPLYFSNVMLLFWLLIAFTRSVQGSGSGG